MKRYKMVVLSDPTQGQEEQYNRWYQDVHLPELLGLEGLKFAKRFRRARTLGERETYSYMAVYEIETDDIDAVMGNLVHTAQCDQLTLSCAIDTAHSHAVVYGQIGFEVFEPQ